MLNRSSNVDVERKTVRILRLLSEAREPVGARVLARQLKEEGIDLSERAVRYHLKIMDERGLTQLRGRDGRTITESGVEELKNALVTDKIGYIIARIEALAFKTTFDPVTRGGQVVVNTSFFPEDTFKPALHAMRDAFQTGICVSQLVAVAREGEKVGDLTVPKGQVALSTVCSVTANGVLLKAGIPMDSRFGGLLQIRQDKPIRFVDLVHYSGSTLDPSEAFIRARMTSVGQVARHNEGKILANFREIPAACRPLAEEVIDKMRQAGIGGLLLMGEVSEPVCQIPVGLNRVGVILVGGLNPVAAAQEAGFEAVNMAMSTAIDYSRLVNFWDLF